MFASDCLSLLEEIDSRIKCAERDLAALKVLQSTILDRRSSVVAEYSEKKEV